MKEYNFTYQSAQITMKREVKKIRCDIYEIIDGRKKFIGNAIKNDPKDIEELVEEVKERFPYEKGDEITSVGDMQTHPTMGFLIFLTPIFDFYEMRYIKYHLRNEEK